MRSLPRSAFLLMLTFAMALSSHAQLGAVKSSTAAKNGLSVQSGTVSIEISAVSATAFRVRYAPSGKFSTNASFVVVGQNVTDVSVQRRDTAHEITLSTGKLTASIDRNTGAIAFLDADGRVISRDAPGFPVEFHGAAF